MERKLKYIAGIACCALAIAWFSQMKHGSDSVGVPDMLSDGNPPLEFRRDSRARLHQTTNLENEPSPIPRALELPPGKVDEKNLQGKESVVAIAATPRRLSLPDDEILIRGGVLPAATKAGSVGDKVNGPRSIKSEDWKGAANLLVNALRAGDRFEVNHDQLRDFLHGKDLLGWPEGYRNWIGDELMTALQQSSDTRTRMTANSILKKAE